jgi:anti-anti-sigma regulatory factor
MPVDPLLDAAPDFEVRLARDGATSILSLLGVLDAFAAPAFTDAVRESLFTSPRAVVFDLSRAVIDPAGLPALLAAVDRCRRRGVALAYANLDGELGRSLGVEAHPIESDLLLEAPPVALFVVGQSGTA